MKSRRGFTLIELLVVMAVIMLLLAILVPVLRAAKEQTYRVVCTSRERNLLLSLTIYAGNNNNNLPYERPGGGGSFGAFALGRYWELELLKIMGTDVEAIGDKKIPLQLSENFYCPTNNLQRRCREHLWYWGSIHKVDEELHEMSIIGYYLPVFGFYRTKDDSDEDYGSGKHASEDDWFWKHWRNIDRIDIPKASETELVVDLTMDFISTHPKTLGKVVYSPTEGYHIEVNTSHYSNRMKPAGGNIGFVDGHVEWRKFSDMIWRVGGHVAHEQDRYYW